MIACSSKPEPMSTDTRTAPRITPASTAVSAETTKAEMRTRSTGTPARRAACGLSAHGMQQAPEIGAVHAPPEDDAKDDETNDRDRQDGDDGHILDIEAPEKAERIGQVAARRTARPHEGDAIERDHHAHVAISEGTFR